MERTGPLLCALALLACSRTSSPGGRAGAVRLVFKHQPMWGDPEPFRRLLDAFARDNPGVELVPQTIPNDSDLVHQLYLTALEGGAADVDVLVADVVWIPEFARAGWIADLSEAFPPDRLRREMLPGPAEVAVRDGRTFAVPWYADVGLLYYRTDLVASPPRTYRELANLAHEAMASRPGLEGYLWQGRQYEGLSCNAFEAIWGHGGRIVRGERVVLDSAEARDALGWLRGLVTSGASPAWVTSSAEEESRRAFQQGSAVFMRNWPYAWAELQSPGSPVRGRVGTAPLPTVSGEPGPGALGGWFLAVARSSPPERRAAAERLIGHLSSPEANLLLAVHYARNPPRRAAYGDPRLRAEAPFVAGLLPLLERARPRPITPWYGLFSDAVQGELSAAVAGVRPPAEALTRAQRQLDRIAGEAP